MRKYILLSLLSLFIFHYVNGQNAGGCVTLTFKSGKTADYCGPQECRSSYQAWGDNPEDINLKTNYENCIENGKVETETETQSESEGTMGINVDPKCLVNGQCGFDIYETLGIRKSSPRETRSEVGLFLKDVILSATYFIGTLMTIVIIISGLMFVFSAANPTLQQKAKKGLIGAFIGLLMVSGSYAVIRFIQFLATGGGG